MRSVRPVLHFFNKLFKSRITTQRIPKWHQFQLAIAEVAWVPDCDGELFACEILVASPRSNHRQILDHCDASERILSYRTKLHRTAAFPQCFFPPPESGVDQTKHAHCRTVIWLSLDNFLVAPRVQR
jgi:hypothetical protein